MTKDELKDILDLHKKWVNDYTGGERADLRGAYLRGAYLQNADLRGADLRGANLRGADLQGAYLQGADLQDAYLRYADLRGANLRGADLRGADLRDAYLRGADLRYAYLRDAKIEFYKFPSPSMMAAYNYEDLPDDLCLELMRRDAAAHPHPELFDAWAKNEKCPYDDVDRYWLFEPKKELWSPGPPQMRDSDLILALCRHMGWGIRPTCRKPAVAQ